jgi:hypothetical protein
MGFGRKIRSNLGYIIGILILSFLVLRGLNKQSTLRYHGVYAVGHVFMRHSGGRTTSITYEYVEKGRRYFRRQDVTAKHILPSEYYLIIVDTLDPSESLLLGDHPLNAVDTSKDWRSLPLDKEHVSFWNLQ